MALFNRKPPHDFWRTSPFRAAPEALYQHGLTAVGRQDGREMIRVGWTIWRQAGMHRLQAYDLLTDGYDLWRREPGVDYHWTLDFLTDLFDMLWSDDEPPCPTDIYRAPREAVEPAASYYGARAWAGTELYLRAEEAGDQATLTQYREAVFDALTTSNPEFLPPRSLELGRRLASVLCRPDPFPRQA